ncbi:MAG: KH domain-containing protein [Thermaerobacter sp.]|nr:KH domain-containing protein [Thermaerobacter sp.]
MDEALVVLVRALVKSPEAVRIERHDEGRRLLFVVSVDPDDIGRVVGRSGRIAKSLRAVMRAVGEKEGRQVVVEVK